MRPNSSMQGYSEDLIEASADKPVQMGIRRSRPTNLEKHSEDRRCDLGSQPHRRRESQTRSTQDSAAPTSQRQRPIAPNVIAVSADIPGANWARWTPSDQLQHPDRTKRCPPSPFLCRQLILNALPLVQ
ncbi:hypothetical protein SprV_0301104400 [Sparganum proliferum]